MNQPLVKDYMAPYPITVAPDTTLPDAHYLMNKNRIRHLPVVKDGELVGVVTRTDILEAEPSDAVALKVWERQYLLSKQEVQKFMTLQPHTIRPDASIAEAAALMLEKKIGCLPVVDPQRRLGGLLTESDVLRAVVCAWEKERKQEAGV